ncbi:insulinase family protein [Candidatus Saccharibacteria bacterium]|nr:insulinase family protein [Candidatus Saccharibacteria bacterium]HPR09082.1 insulinase family protein [Candidatus Saccharibacteria bacterium]
MKHTVEEITLENGAKGLLVHVPDAMVMDVYINFRAGEYLVEREKWETPHLMEHVLLGANDEFPRARDFQAEVEKNGAYSNASTDVYDIVYETECADFEWDRVFRLLLVAITKPLFLQEEFDAEFGNVREELAARANNHYRQLGAASRKAYGLVAETDKDRLELMQNVTLDDVREHYRRTHTTDNMRFVIAGNIGRRRSTIMQMLESIELPRGERFIMPDEVVTLPKSPVAIHNSSVDTLYFYIDTFQARRLEEAELDALSVANAILTETLYSKILGTARERGLVYSMNSGFQQIKLSSNLWFGSQVSVANAPALFDIVIEQLGNVFRGELAEADIAAAQAYVIGRYQRSAQTVASTAGGYTGRYFFDEHVDDYYQYPERIQAVTKQSIVNATRAMFSEGVGGLGLYGSATTKLATDLNAQIAPLWEQSRAE